MRGHTPGTWEVEWFPKHLIVKEHGSDQAVCRISTWRDDVRGRSGEELRANAELIAAAPDLLESLQDVLSCWKDEWPIWTEGKVYNAAFAAIAKATGMEEST